MNREEAEHCRAKAPEQRANKKRDDHRQARHLGEERDTIGPKSEIGGMAERGEPANRHQEMQADGKDHEDCDFRADGERVIAAEKRQRRRDDECACRREPFAGRQCTPRIDGQSRRAACRPLLLAEQAPGTHDQDGGHHQKHQDDRYLREDQDAERVQFRYQHRRDKGANDAAEPTDHDHHEDIDDDPQIHGVMHRIAWNLQGTAERRQKYADRKHAGEQPFLIDAERRHHVAVLRRRAHQHAPARALEQQP